MTGGRARLSVSIAPPGQAVLHGLRTQAEQLIHGKQTSEQHFSMVPASTPDSRFLPRLSGRMDSKLQDEMNVLFLLLLLVLVLQ